MSQATAKRRRRQAANADRHVARVGRSIRPGPKKTKADRKADAKSRWKTV